MVVQGCIGTTVNQGPMEMALVFLSSVADGTQPPTKLTNKLRLCFKDFSKKYSCYISYLIHIHTYIAMLKCRHRSQMPRCLKKEQKPNRCGSKRIPEGIGKELSTFY